MKAHQRTAGKNDEWLTPRWVLEPLGEFDLDPCAPVTRPWETARRHFTVLDDGLSQQWQGRVWCNPPFNRFQRPDWMGRMAQHGDGIMLVPAACETKAFQQFVFGRAHGLLMLHSRPRFHFVTGEEAPGNAGATICLVAYGEQNGQVLQRSGLGTYLVEAH